MSDQFTGDEQFPTASQSSVSMALGELRVMMQMSLRQLAENKGEIDKLYDAMRSEIENLRSYVHNRFDTGERRLREIEQAKSSTHDQMNARIAHLETEIATLRAAIRPRGAPAPQILASGASVCAILAFLFLFGSKLGW